MDGSRTGTAASHGLTPAPQPSRNSSKLKINGTQPGRRRALDRWKSARWRCGNNAMATKVSKIAGVGFTRAYTRVKVIPPVGLDVQSALGMRNAGFRLGWTAHLIKFGYLFDSIAKFVFLFFNDVN